MVAFDGRLRDVRTHESKIYSRVTFCPASASFSAVGVDSCHRACESWLDEEDGFPGEGEVDLLAAGAPGTKEESPPTSTRPPPAHS